jgi:hypothetical protein
MHLTCCSATTLVAYSTIYSRCTHAGRDPRVATALAPADPRQADSWSGRCSRLLPRPHCRERWAGSGTPRLPLGKDYRQDRRRRSGRASRLPPRRSSPSRAPEVSTASARHPNGEVLGLALGWVVDVVTHRSPGDRVGPALHRDLAAVGIAESLPIAAAETADVAEHH